MEILDDWLNSDTRGYGDSNGEGYDDGIGYGDDRGCGRSCGYGYGYGYGSASGEGDGRGYGRGRGSEGTGYRDGSGCGSGNDIGSAMASYNGKKVYKVDWLPTIIESVDLKRNIARGYIIEALQLIPCYIAKVHGYFAHGMTVRKAYYDALAKWQSDQPLEERIEEFIKQYPTTETVVANKDLFEWHHILTGSCEMGRKSFANQRDIDVEHGSMTVGEFIELTESEYGGEAIEQLKESYQQQNK